MIDSESFTVIFARSFPQSELRFCARERERETQERRTSDIYMTRKMNYFKFTLIYLAKAKELEAY